MWDRLLVDCNIATMEPAPGDPLGVDREWRDRHRGRRGSSASASAPSSPASARSEVEPLGGAWVTPGLVDCHTHLVFGGTRADEHAMRRAGATYEEIAKAGGGIASTVAATARRRDDELLEQSPPPPAGADGAAAAPRSRSSPATGSTPRANCGCSKLAKALGESEAVRIVPTLLALHALPPDSATAATHSSATIVDKLIPAAAEAELATSVDAFCETIAFTPDEVERLFKAAARPRPPASSSTPSNCPTSTAPRSPPSIEALSADHLEHLDEAGAKAMAARRHGRGAAARRLLRAAGKEEAAGRAAARPRRADRGRDRLQPRHLAGAVADADDEHGLHPVRPDAGGSACRDDHQRRARARPRSTRSAASPPARPPTSASGGSTALAELGYWIGLPGPSGGSSEEWTA